MDKLFTDNAWKDYVYWQTQDKKVLKRINALLDDISRNINTGIGKPEALSNELSGYYSRRINEKDRLIYKVVDEKIYILACRTHYGDK